MPRGVSDECLLECFKFLARYNLLACLFTSRRFAAIILDAVSLLPVHKRKLPEIYSVLAQLSEAYCASVPDGPQKLLFIFLMRLINYTAAKRTDPEFARANGIVQELSDFSKMGPDRGYSLGSFHVIRNIPRFDFTPWSKDFVLMASLAWVDGEKVPQLYGKSKDVICKELADVAKAFSELEVTFAKKNGPSEYCQRRIFTEPLINDSDYGNVYFGINQIELTFDREAIKKLLNDGFLNHAEGSCPVCGLRLPPNESLGDQLANEEEEGESSSPKDTPQSDASSQASVLYEETVGFRADEEEHDFSDSWSSTSLETPPICNIHPKHRAEYACRVCNMIESPMHFGWGMKIGLSDPQATIY